MKNLSIVVGIIFLSFSISSAQSHNFEFELDPLAYALGGGSGHVAYTFKNERIQLGYGQLTLPEQMQNHEGVTERFKSISLKWDYFFGKENPNHGFFAGPTFDYLFLTYEDNENTFEENQLSVGLRAGYRFDVFKNSSTLKGLYITPWIGISSLTNSDDFELSNQVYSRKALNFFPTVHIGYSF